MKKLLATLKAFFASLVARFKKPAVKTPAVETPPFEVPATPAPVPAAPAPQAPSITDLLFGVGKTPVPPVNVPVSDTPPPSVSGDSLDFNVVRNQNMILSGSFKKVFTNCPPAVYFQVINASESPVKMTVNGVDKVADNPQALTRASASGPIVEVTVVQTGQADFTILAA